MALLIQNETKLDGRRVGGIVRWVLRELDVQDSRLVVKVKHHSGFGAYSGRCYVHAHSQQNWVWNQSWGEYQLVGPSIPDSHSHLLVCRVAKPGYYPMTTSVYERRGNPEPWVVSDWQEALVCITAHEAMHLRQYQQWPKRRARGAKRGRFNEKDTEWAAYRLWRKWCKKQGRTGSLLPEEARA